MATCNVATLLSSGKDFQKLSDRDLQIAQAELLREILGTNPSVDTLLLNGAKFRQLSDQDLEMAQAQLLCELVGGIV